MNNFKNFAKVLAVVVNIIFITSTTIDVAKYVKGQWKKNHKKIQKS
ncbi:MAG: hypothetical protein LIP03_14665 [Bacteroidales bacterium]|nr:hypothetical protein [Bacteroidales bacterium]